MGYDRGDSLPFDFLKQMELHLVQNRKENCGSFGGEGDISALDNFLNEYLLLGQFPGWILSLADNHQSGYFLTWIIAKLDNFTVFPPS